MSNEILPNEALPQEATLPGDVANATAPAVRRTPAVSPQRLEELLARPRVPVWGLNLTPWTYEETLDAVDGLIQQVTPSFFITANLNYAMLTDRDARLLKVNRKAAFVLADGMPLVWHSRCQRHSLPERVAGSDLIYGLCERAANQGHRVFFLGGAPGIADECVSRLCQLYPGLQIAGVAVPPFRKMSELEELRLISQIRECRPHLLFAALGQPKGELWLAKHYEKLGCVGVQVGASFDFVVGKVDRAPVWMQRTGTEWIYRMSSDPKRLVPRYWSNACFLAKAVSRDLLSLVTRPRD